MEAMQGTIGIHMTTTMDRAIAIALNANSVVVRKSVVPIHSNKVIALQILLTMIKLETEVC